jgi:SAM-dependent methyltransferase
MYDTVGHLGACRFAMVCIITPEDTIINDTNLYNRKRRPLNGAFKGRGRNYVTLLTCPVDGGPLRKHNGGLQCTADKTHSYPFEDGILRLVPAAMRPAIDAQSEAYDSAQAAHGWTAPDESQFKKLPQTGLPGYGEGYWAKQASATALLWRFLEAIRLDSGALPIAPLGEAAVIGAGMGWLAYGLDVAGYTTVALDARAGEQYGLGVYPIARYLRVQASRIDPPLAPAAFDFVIYQEGLARSGDEAEQERAFDNALRALRPGGWMIAMDTLGRFSDDGTTVHTLFEDAGLVLMAAPRRLGWRGRLLELRDRLAGRDPGLPPVLVAQKP